MENRTYVTLATVSSTTATPFKSQMGTGFQFLTPTKRRLSTSKLPILQQVLKPALPSHIINSVFLLPSNL